MGRAQGVERVSETREMSSKTHRLAGYCGVTSFVFFSGLHIGSALIFSRKRLAVKQTRLILSH